MPLKGAVNTNLTSNGVGLCGLAFAYTSHFIPAICCIHVYLQIWVLIRFNIDRRCASYLATVELLVCHTNEFESIYHVKISVVPLMCLGFSSSCIVS